MTLPPSRNEIEKHYADAVLDYPIFKDGKIKSKKLILLLNYYCMIVEYEDDNRLVLYKIVNNDRLTKSYNLDYGHNSYCDFELIDSIVWLEMIKNLTIPIVYIVEVGNRNDGTSISKIILHDMKCVDVTSQHLIYPIYNKSIKIINWNTLIFDEYDIIRKAKCELIKSYENSGYFEDRILDRLYRYSIDLMGVAFDYKRNENYDDDFDYFMTLLSEGSYYFSHIFSNDSESFLDESLESAYNKIRHCYSLICKLYAVSIENQNYSPNKHVPYNFKSSNFDKVDRIKKILEFNWTCRDYSDRLPDHDIYDDQFSEAFDSYEFQRRRKLQCEVDRYLRVLSKILYNAHNNAPPSTGPDFF